MPSCKGQHERNSQLTRRQKDGDALDIAHQTPHPHCHSSRPGAKYNVRPNHPRHIWCPRVTSRLKGETYLDIGAQDGNPYRACSSSNPTHHIGSFPYMRVNLPRNAGECDSRPVCRIAIDVYIPNISQYLYIVTILDLSNQLEPLASQLLQQVIFLLALLDQALPSIYLQLFIVYR